MALSKSSENMLMEYQQDNAYLKRAFDLQERFIVSMQQQIVELRNKNTILCEKTVALQNEKTILNEQAEEKLRNLLTEMQNNTAIIQAERDNTDKQLCDLRIENEALLNEIKQLQESKRLLENERELLVNALDGIQNSTIWKSARPLRKILDFVKGIGKRESLNSNMTDER